MDDNAANGQELRQCAYKECQVEFEPKVKHQRFHSPKCRYEAWKLKNFVGIDGTLTSEQIATVRCRYSHPGVRQVK